MSHGLESEIRALAYRLWQEAGHPEGRDLDFWLEAEILLAVTPPAAVPAPAPEAPKAAKPRATKPKAPAKPRTEAVEKPKRTKTPKA